MHFQGLKTPVLFLRYAIPQMIGLVFNSVYFIVDGIFIGRRLGTTALAAAGVAVPVVEISFALSMLVSVGAGVLLSAAAGQGKQKTARGIFNLGMAVTLFVALLLGGLGSVFVRPLAVFLGAGPALLADTVTYLQYFLAFSPFLVLSFSLSTFARNDGRPTLAMLALTAGSLSNILLDYVFMYPLNMGMAGAALATGLGPLFSVLILLPHFLRKKGTLYFQRFSFRAKTALQILGAGAPAFVSEFSIGFVTLLHNQAIVKNGLGQGGLAAYMVIGYAALIFLTAFLGAAQGLQPAVSYFSGAGQPGRTRDLLRLSAAFCLGFAVLFYLAIALAGPLFFGIFIRDDAALLSFTAAVARLYFLNLPFAALNILFISFLQSSGFARSSLAISLLRSTLPLGLFLLILPALFPQAGLWLAVALAEGSTLLLATGLWARAARRMGACKTQLLHTPLAKSL